MLILPIKEKWFDMIKSGEKKEEYRECKKYYHIRFKKIFGWWNYKNKEVEIIFRNGYRKDSPTIKCKCRIKNRKLCNEYSTRRFKSEIIIRKK